MSRKTLYLIVFLSVAWVPCYADGTVWEQSFLLASDGKYTQAAVLLEPMVSANNEYALMRSAYLQYLAGKYSRSADLYKRAIELNADSIGAKIGITLPFLAQKRWRQVRRYALDALEQSPLNYIASVRLLTAEEGLRNWQTLKVQATQLAKHYPSDATAWVYIARAGLWQGDTEAAKAAYQQVLIRVPAHIEANAYLGKD